MNNDLISRRALMELAHNHVGGVVDCNDIARFPAVDAEPVRHEGNTTFVSTNNLDAYADRIIVGQGTLCKVYYADESAQHGRWIWDDDGYLRCSECTQKAPVTTQHQDEPIQTATNYCPNCGCKMDAEVEG